VALSARPKLVDENYGAAENGRALRPGRRYSPDQIRHGKPGSARPARPAPPELQEQVDPKMAR